MRLDVETGRCRLLVVDAQVERRDRGQLGQTAHHRHARGVAYMRYMQMRHPSDLNHRLREVPGVGHQGKAMFVSACGLAALFDRPGGGPS